MFGVGMQELILILVVALIVLGPKKLPEIAKVLGRGLAEFRKAADDLKDSLDMNGDLRDLGGAFKEVKKDLGDTLLDAIDQAPDKAPAPDSIPDKAPDPAPDSILGSAPASESAQDSASTSAPAPEPAGPTGQGGLMESGVPSEAGGETAGPPQALSSKKDASHE